MIYCFMKSCTEVHFAVILSISETYHLPFTTSWSWLLINTFCRAHGWWPLHNKETVGLGVDPAIHNGAKSISQEFCPWTINLNFQAGLVRRSDELLFSAPVAPSLPGVPASCWGSLAGLCHAARCPSWCPHKAAPGLLTQKAAHNSLPLQGSNSSITGCF